MFAALTVDGDPVGLSDDVPETARVELNPDAPAYLCRSCGEELIKTPHGFEDMSGEATCEYAESGHDPERIPLSWCNSADLHMDEMEDSITVSISVGDPRGAFTLTIRRVPDDVSSELAGYLLMHVPYPGETTPHVELNPLHDGTHIVGGEAPVQRQCSAPNAE